MGSSNFGRYFLHQTYRFGIFKKLIRNVSTPISRNIVWPGKLMNQSRRKLKLFSFKRKEEDEEGGRVACFVFSKDSFTSNNGALN